MKDNKENCISFKKAILIFTSVLISGLAIGGSAGFLITRNAYKLSPEEQKLIEGYRLLKDDWLFGNEEEHLASLAAAGLISSVADENGDPYTFYTGTEAEQGLSTNGKGFGFSSHSYNGGLYITEIHPGSSAEQSKNMFVGDVIYGVTRGDEKYYDFTTHSYSEVNSYLGEDKGDVVYSFSIKRAGENITVNIKKGFYSQKLIDIVATPVQSNNYTIVVKINTFLGDPVSALKGTLQFYMGKYNELVLDLRGNGGGYVSQAEEMAKLFVRKGTLINKLVDKNGKTLSSMYQTEEPYYAGGNNIKYSMILDGNSASASESFALAMRAGCDAKIYGLKSFGKGIAQNFKYFSDGSVIRYTYAYVYGPERENETMYDEGSDDDDIMCIHKKGIIPDKTFSVDYGYLNSVADYTTSLGISAYAQEFFLKALNEIHPGEYPTSYSKNYHFVDAIKEYGTKSAILYSDVGYSQAFSDDGFVSRHLNNLFVKECYDKYLEYYNALTSEVLNDL